MSITQQPRTATRAAAAYQLRLHGGTEDERLIDLRPGKHSVGSGARCQIRLDAPGVAAMECLLVCDRAGLRVRRWSDKTLLNGQPFEEAALAEGDLITVGPLELTIVVPEQPAEGSGLDGESDNWAENRLQSACDAIDDIFLAEESAAERSPSHNGHDHWEDDRPSRPTQRIVRPAPAPPAPTTPPDSLTKSAVRRRSRRALAVIRRQRQDHDELLSRVKELEQLLAQSLAEPVAPQPAAIQPPASDESKQELAAANERLAALGADLVAVQDSLAVRDSELKQARFSIDALERQLIDSQHTMNAFAEERVHWDEQFNEIESRLTKYVERIQELEEQLAASESRKTAEPAASIAEAAEQDAEQEIDWETELAPAAAEFSTASPVASNEVAELQTEEPEAVAAVATAVEEAPSESPSDDYDWQQDVTEAATHTSESEVETVVATPEEAAAEPIDVTERGIDWASEIGAVETDSDEPKDAASDHEVDQALDRLRGISIWRESPAADSEVQDHHESHGVSKPAETSQTAAPVSFLDRYAHMFTDDKEDVAPLRHEDNTAPLREAVPPPEVHADEESVEQYMAKLLDRMRGGPAGSSVSSSFEESQPRAVEPSPAPVARQVEQPPAERPMFTHLEEMKTKAAAPEQPSDMAAMRALANQSARHALSLHAARKLRRTAITRVIVTALAASVAVYLLLNSPTWRSLAFAAGCAAAFASLYWGMLTMGTLLKGFQLGAFDDYEEEVADENSLNPPLPIDVDHEQQETAVVESAANDGNEHSASEAADRPE
jgi:hypothetical protein